MSDVAFRPAPPIGGLYCKTAFYYLSQARPDDYSEQYLVNHVPVTFHRHWMIDPYRVYQQWLSSSSTPIPAAGETGTKRDDL